MDPTTSSTGSGMRSVLIIVVIVALAVLAFMNYKQRVALEQQVQNMTLQQNGQVGNQQNAEAAKRIVDRVKKHVMIPGDVDPTVATIVDVEALKSKNDFYKNAKNGDHLIVTPTRAILYDPDKDLVIDVVPVQLTPNQPATASSAAAQ